MCAQALAHARSGVRIAIASHLGNEPSFDRALADFVEMYADLNERDYEVLQQAAADGWITAESGLWIHRHRQRHGYRPLHDAGHPQ